LLRGFDGKRPLNPIQNAEHRASGMTEVLTTDLAQIGALEVRARGSVTQERVSGKTTRQIARELKVDAVVEGAVQRSNDHVLITAQLIEASTERHLWARSYERQMQNALSLQNQLTQDIAREIGVALSAQERSQLSKTGSVNPEAQEAYMQGQFQLKSLYFADRALKYFQEATAKDPEFVEAWAAQSECYGLLILSGVLSGSEGRQQWRAAVTRALELDNMSAEAHYALAVLLNYQDWNWDEADREFQTALRLNPNHALAHLWYGDNLMTHGRISEATQEILRANQLDPFSVTTNTLLALLLFSSRRYDEALAQADKLAELQKGSDHPFRGIIYEQKGKFEQAIAAMTWPPEWEERKVSPIGVAIADMAHAYASAGNKEAALRLLRKLTELSKHRRIQSYSFALIYAGLGDKDHAFEWLAKAYDERPSDIGHIKTDPRLDPLRTDARYSEILRRMGLPQ